MCVHEDFAAQSSGCKFEADKDAKAQLLKPVSMPKGANFHEAMLARVCAIFDGFGGPRQYLDAVYKSLDAKKSFRKALVDAYPSMDRYLDTALPAHKMPFLVHLSDLAWEECSSTKPAPYKHTCRALVDQYLVDTFLTEHEPLLLSTKVSPNQGLGAFWTCFVKGAARSATALVLAEQAMVCCRSSGGDVAEYCPDLARSFSLVHVRVHVTSQDDTAIAFENAKMSSRGSIRKAHDVVTWLGTFTMLRKSNVGLDASALLN